MPTSVVTTNTTQAGALERKYLGVFRDAVHRHTRWIEMIQKGLPNGGAFQRMQEEKLRSTRAIWRQRYQYNEGNSAHDEGGAFGTRGYPSWAEMYETIARFNFGINISNEALEVAMKLATKS